MCDKVRVNARVYRQIFYPVGRKRLENSNSSFNLATAFVNDIIEDKDNNLWIGCYNKGLYLINQRQQAFNSWSFSAQNYIIGSIVPVAAFGHI